MEAKALDLDFMYKVASVFGYTVDEVRSKNRKADLCEIRQILSYELRENGFKLEEIASLLNRDHSTVLWNIKGYVGKMIHDRIFKEKVLKVERIKENMTKILLPLDNSKLYVLNNSMQILDTLDVQNQPRRLKSSLSICVELRTELLQKAIKTRQKDKSFILKMTYYKADALWNFLNEYEVYFPDNFESYEKNAILIMRNELHKQLQ